MADSERDFELGGWDSAALKWLWREGRPRAGAARLGHMTLQVTYLALRNSLRDRLPFQANALTFISLLALVPALAISFSLAKGLGFAERLRELLITSEITANQSEVLQQLLTYVDRTNVGALGLVGLVLLVASLVLALSSVEETFNRIWDVSASRSYFRKFTDYLSVLVICPLLIAAAATIWAGVSSNEMVNWLRDQAVIGPLTGFGLNLGPFLLLTVAFTFLYMFIPNTGVPWRSALVAGVISAALWWGVQSAYIFFQIGVAKYNAIYGGFASLPLFLVWLQVSWQVVLVGAELSYAHHICRSGQPPSGVVPPLSTAQRQVLAFRMMLVVARRFHAGQPPLALGGLSEELGVAQREVLLAYRDLQDAGLLHEPGCDGLVLPARDLSAISLMELLGAVTRQAPQEAQAEPELRGLLEKLYDAERQALGDMSLLELVRRSPSQADQAG